MGEFRFSNLCLNLRILQPWYWGLTVEFWLVCGGGTSSPENWGGDDPLSWKGMTRLGRVGVSTQKRSVPEIIFFAKYNCDCMNKFLQNIIATAWTSFWNFVSLLFTIQAHYIKILIMYNVHVYRESCQLASVCLYSLSAKGKFRQLEQMSVRTFIKKKKIVANQ